MNSAGLQRLSAQVLQSTNVKRGSQCQLRNAAFFRLISDVCNPPEIIK